MVAGLFGMFFLGALYMQRVLHYDAIEVGLAFLPVALGIAAMSLGLSARLITRFGARQTLLPGLVFVALGPGPVPRRAHRTRTTRATCSRPWCCWASGPASRSPR